MKLSIPIIASITATASATSWLRVQLTICGKDPNNIRELAISPVEIIDVGFIYKTQFCAARLISASPDLDPNLVQCIFYVNGSHESSYIGSPQLMAGQRLVPVDSFGGIFCTK